MPPLSNASWAISVAVVALVGWRIYARARRMIGRQTLSRVRAWLAIVFFPLLVAVLLFSTFRQPAGALALLCGVGLGISLGLYGLHLTRFEETPKKLFYTPNAYLGIALSLMLVARIVYRLGEAFVSGTLSSAPPSDFVQSPLTLAIFGTLAGYYVAYAIGLLRWHRQARNRNVDI